MVVSEGKIELLDSLLKGQMQIPLQTFLGTEEFFVIWEQTWPAWLDPGVCKRRPASIIIVEDHINLIDRQPGQVGDIRF